MAEDGGKFVDAILAEPAKYEGKTFHAATALYTLEEMCRVISVTTGQRVVYKQVPVEEFKRIMELPENLADMFVEALSFYEAASVAYAVMVRAISNKRRHVSALNDLL